MVDLHKSQQSLNDLLTLMGIKRIVCVDDLYSKEPSVSDVIALCSELDGDVAKSVPKLGNVAFEKNRRVWSRQVRAIWQQISGTEKDEIYRDLRRKLSKVEKEEVESADTLDELLKNHDFRKLSLKQWKTSKKKILDSVRQNKTLFLFDQDFSDEAGGTSTTGIFLLKEVLGLKRTKSVMCGLLSRTFTAADEYSEWTNMAQQYSINKDRFVLISKQRLREDRNPSGFVRMIRLTALSPQCQALKTAVSTVIEMSQQRAMKQVDQMNIYDFDQIVFKSSKREGIWEPDTLFRIFGLYQRLAAREEARKNPALEKLSAYARSVSDIPIDQDESVQLSSWQIQRLELYEEGDYLNQYHIPLDLGDIFEKVSDNDGPGKQFILLAQPCDLMVRSDGKRHHSVTEAILAEISNKEPNKNQDEGSYELPFYDRETGGGHYVLFRNRHTVNLRVLDMAVFQEDGAARLEIGANCPENVIPAWKKLHSYLMADVTKVVDRYALVTQAGAGADALPDIKRSAIPVTSNDNLFKGEIKLNPRSISYKVKRVGRLSQPRAGALLTHFSNYFARAAFDIDFGTIG